MLYYYYMGICMSKSMTEEISSVKKQHNEKRSNDTYHYNYGTERSSRTFIYDQYGDFNNDPNDECIAKKYSYGSIQAKKQIIDITQKDVYFDTPSGKFSVGEVNYIDIHSIHINGIKKYNVKIYINSYDELISFNIDNLEDNKYLMYFFSDAKLSQLFDNYSSSMRIENDIIIYAYYAKHLDKL